MKTRHLILILMLFVAGASRAQEAMMPLPEELKKLEWMLGKWEGSIKWTMPGMEGEAKMAFEATWDGQFQKQSSTMEMMGMKMIETAYIGWDAAKKQYSMYTFTNFAPTPRVEYGKFDGTTWVSISEPWATGMGSTVSRSTIVKKSNTELDLTVEFKEGDKWNKVGVATFKKKS